MRCAHCEVDYPPEILNPLFTDKGTTPPICGICALEASNKTLPPRLRRSGFDGEMAEDARQRALAHRRVTQQRGRRNE
jgi:hypothetical protein